MSQMLLAKAATGVGSAGSGALLGLLLLTEVGLPIPIPADLLMILLGERVSAGAFPLVGALVALQVIAVVGTLVLFWIVRGPGRVLLARIGPRVGVTEERIARVNTMLERRGAPAVALARSTPGLRTVTVVAAGTAERSTSAIVLALLAGSTLFVQGHFLLGLALGPAARAMFERAGAATLGLIVLLLVVGLIVWFRRRSRAEGLQKFSEACCPACLALSGLSRLDASSTTSSGPS